MTTSPTHEARALHLLPHQGVGGVQRFAIELIRHERMDQAWDEIVLTERPLDVDVDFLAPATPVHFLGLTGDRVAVRGKRLCDLAESKGAQVLHVYCARDLELAVEAKRRSKDRLRILTTFFDSPEASSGFRGFFGKRKVRAAVAAIDAFYVTSPALVAPWSAESITPEVRLVAVDTQRFHPQEVVSSWRAARLPDPNTLLVGSMMRAAPDKGHDVLIEAVERRHAAGRPTALMLVGDGPLYGDLRARAKASDVLFARRRVLDGPGFFGRVDVFALHSATELVPVSLVEALSCGRASTVADPGGVARLVGEDAALFTEPGNVEAVIESLDRLDDRAFRKELGEAARQRALQRHNLGRLRSQLRDAYAAPVS